MGGKNNKLLKEDKFELIHFGKDLLWNSHTPFFQAKLLWYPTISATWGNNCGQQHKLGGLYKQQLWYGPQKVFLDRQNFPLERYPHHYPSFFYFCPTSSWILLWAVLSLHETKYYESWSYSKVNFKKDSWHDRPWLLGSTGKPQTLFHPKPLWPLQHLPYETAVTATISAWCRKDSTCIAQKMLASPSRKTRSGPRWQNKSYLHHITTVQDNYFTSIGTTL